MLSKKNKDVLESTLPTPFEWPALLCNVHDVKVIIFLIPCKSFLYVLKHVRNICITDFFVLSLQRINNKSNQDEVLGL